MVQKQSIQKNITIFNNNRFQKYGQDSKSIGNCKEIDYSKAYLIAKKISTDFQKPTKKSLKLISDEYLKAKALAPATVKKHNHMLKNFDLYLKKQTD